MKIHGLDLDNSPLISQDKALRYAQNIAIGEGNQSYINEDGFELKFDIVSEVQEYISDITNLIIIGTIPTNIGVVLFCVSNNADNKIDLIVYIKTDTDEPTIQKILYSDNLNFDVSRPIHGDYIYNYKEELIVTFTEGVDTNANETRVINLTSPYGGQYNNSTILYNITNISSLNLIPDVEYPKMTIYIKEGGNLKTGAYQIAISYKLQDGTYTNYSILSVPVIVCGNYGEDYAPNSEINRKIIVSFKKPNISYDTYKLGIVHCNGISQDCYETEDISLENDSNNYTISNLNNYNTIVLDDIFIKNISYIREKTLVNYNNRLIRGNVQTLNYQDLNDILKLFTNQNIKVEIEPIYQETYINSSKPYFKLDESYVLFVGYFDYKGDLINIYHIPNSDPNTSLFEGKDFTIQNKSIDNPFNITNKYFPTNIQSGSFTNIPFGYTNTFNNIVFSKKWDAKSKGLIITPKIAKIQKINNIECHYATITNNTGYDLKLNFIIEDKVEGVKLYLNGTTSNALPLDCNIQHYILKLNTISEDNIVTDYTNLTPNIKDISADGHSPINTYWQLTDDMVNAIQLQNNSSIDICIADIIVYDTNINDLAFKFKITENSTRYTSYDNSLYGGYNFKISILNNDTIPEQIKSIAYFYIEHNTYNSRVLSQALCIPDININDFASSQEYKGQFQGEFGLRFYPFEYLYNRITKLSSIVKWRYNIGKSEGTGTYDDNGKLSFATIGGGGDLPNTYGLNLSSASGQSKGIQFLDCDINNIGIVNEDDHVVSLEYISHDNTSQQNIAGDSYYRTRDITIVNYPNVTRKTDTSAKSEYGSQDGQIIDEIEYVIADLINSADDLYSNLDNQKLQIASPIIPIDSVQSITLTGDTFLSYLTLRLTSPDSAYIYGDNENKKNDSNATVWRWIFTFPIESKYNITARYSNNIIDKPYFLHNAKLEKYIDLLSLSYKVDNFINTETGKGYNPVYNENGIEQFSYYKEIPGTSNHPYRIIRSLAQNPESIALNWRTFKTDDYKDLPFNRGEIISLKTDNKNLYIQQKYGLHLLQQRDQLNNDDANNSYLGTSDLFNMEPKEIVYSPSGYIGCESYFDTDVNIAGYIVIDAVHKKIFLINGDKPLEISNIKTREYFEKLIDANLINPYNKQGRIINYNEDRNILYITQINGDDANGKTMSFSPLIKSWVSFHTYIADLGFVNRNGLFWGKNGKLYQPNSTIKGKYWNDTAEPSIIQFILNENTIYNKLLKTIVWKDQVSYKGDNYIEHFFKETINHIMVHNFDQCSGKLDVAFNESREWWNGNTGINKINLWRFNKLFDLVKPDNTSLFMKDVITSDPDTLRVDYKWYEVNRFICQFIYLTLWCNNTNDHEWELIDVHPEWQLDNRNDQTYGNKDNNQ